MKCKSNAVAVRNNEVKQTYSGNKLKYDEKNNIGKQFPSKQEVCFEIVFYCIT